MQTSIDRSAYASYSQTQSFNSMSSKTGSREKVETKQQFSTTSYSQQSSRSQSGASASMSMSMSMASFQAVTNKKGANQSFGFASTQSHQIARNDRPNPCGSKKDKLCKSEVKHKEVHCESQKSKSCNTQVKNDKAQFSFQKSTCSTMQFKDSKNNCFGKQSSWSNSRGEGNKFSCGGRQDNWSNTEVKGNKATIDLGKYKLDLNKSDSSLLLTNSKNGSTTKIWGDPHIDTNGVSGTFKGSMTFNLPDRTKITVGTQEKGAVSYADQLTITKGNKAYVVNGLSQKDSNPLTVEKSHNGRQLDRMTPDGFSLAANSTGTGWINMQTGKAPTAADFHKA